MWNLVNTYLNHATDIRLYLICLYNSTPNPDLQSVGLVEQLATGMGRVSLLLYVVIYAPDNIQFPLIGRFAFGDGLGDVFCPLIDLDAVKARLVPANVCVIVAAVIVFAGYRHLDHNGIVQGVGCILYPRQPSVIRLCLNDFNGLRVVVGNCVSNAYRVPCDAFFDGLIVDTFPHKKATHAAYDKPHG